MTQKIHGLLNERGGYGHIVDMEDGTVLKIPVDRDMADETIIREAAALQVLQGCPGVIQLLGFGTVDGRPCLRLPLIKSPTLDDVQVEWPYCLAAWVGVAAAIERCWERGVIHRDLKPGNVFLTPQGPVVFDFGLSYLVGQEDFVACKEYVIGTPACIPPEAMNTSYHQPTQAYDVYQLGTLLHHMVEGDFPISGNTVMATFENTVAGVRAPIREELVEVRDLLMDERDLESAVKLVGKLCLDLIARSA